MSYAFFPTTPSAPKCIFDISLVQFMFAAFFIGNVSVYAFVKCLTFMWTTPLVSTPISLPPYADIQRLHRSANSVFHNFRFLRSDCRHLRSKSVRNADDDFCPSCSSQTHLMCLDGCYNFKVLKANKTLASALPVYRDEEALVSTSNEVDSIAATIVPAGVGTRSECAERLWEFFSCRELLCPRQQLVDLRHYGCFLSTRWNTQNCPPEAPWRAAFLSPFTHSHVAFLCQLLEL